MFARLADGPFVSRGISFVLSALVFNIVPTIFEVGLVSGVLVGGEGHEWEGSGKYGSLEFVVLVVQIWAVVRRHR